MNGEMPKGLTEAEQQLWKRSVDDRESRLIVGSEVRSMLLTIASIRLAVKTYGESILGGYSDHDEGKVMKKIAAETPVPVMTRAQLLYDLRTYAARYSNSALATSDREKIRTIDIGVDALHNAIKAIESGEA